MPDLCSSTPKRIQHGSNSSLHYQTTKSKIWNLTRHEHNKVISRHYCVHLCVQFLDSLNKQVCFNQNIVGSNLCQVDYDITKTWLRNMINLKYPKLKSTTNCWLEKITIFKFNELFQLKFLSDFFQNWIIQNNLQSVSVLFLRTFSRLHRSTIITTNHVWLW